MSENNLQRGVSLYLALMVMTMLLAIALGINSIFLSQSQTIRVMGHAVLAFYAADAGIEKVLLNRNNPINISETTLDNGATYQVFVSSRGVNGCLADYYCIISIGAYKETKRAVEITY